mmetsp:Transcript_24284/g.61135  ORF Transcript_24284/g.61135 Transcript_24284/m.61135 type:complete len:244 (-) Transcript_24284:889-1620(-)
MKQNVHLASGHRAEEQPHFAERAVSVQLERFGVDLKLVGVGAVAAHAARHALPLHHNVAIARLPDHRREIHAAERMEEYLPRLQRPATPLVAVYGHKHLSRFGRRAALVLDDHLVVLAAAVGGLAVYHHLVVAAAGAQLPSVVAASGIVVVRRLHAHQHRRNTRQQRHTNYLTQPLSLGLVEPERAVHDQAARLHLDLEDSDRPLLALCSQLDGNGVGLGSACRQRFRLRPPHGGAQAAAMGL